MNLSVILCAHNPPMAFLERVLASLREQTLSRSAWEFVVVDNASEGPLAARLDLGWHPLARVVVEKELGLAQAKLRGMREAQAEFLLFVDDDTPLEKDYLERTLAIGAAWPRLGAWSGSIVPEFEATPPEWSKPYLHYLALREVSRDTWSNQTDRPGLMPWGAGTCIRREVATEYARRVAADPVRRGLGRRGKSLGACEDSDLAMTACEMGFGTGLFQSLRLKHIIPVWRLEEDYLLALAEGMSRSLALLQASRGSKPRRAAWPRWLWGHVSALRRGRRDFRFYRASDRGMKMAMREIST